MNAKSHYRLFFIIGLMLLTSVLLDAQAQVVLNEASASNSIFEDVYGDSPDWIELFNNSQSPVNLEGWALTDKLNKPEKWQFRNTEIGPGEYQVIWASGKDKSIAPSARTLINRGDRVKYIIPNSPIDEDWNKLNFDDTQWLEGETSIGYGDDDDQTVTDNGVGSVFVRAQFSMSDISLLEEMYFDIDFDDAFVAYLNGYEIGRDNILGERPAFYENAYLNREAEMYQGGQPLRYVVDPTFVSEGENVLAIQVHNVDINSSDLTVIPFLTAIFSREVTVGIIPPSILSFGEGRQHTNFKISAGESVYLFNAQGELEDSLSTSNLCPEISVGKSLDQSQIVYFESPTPDAANTTLSSMGIITDTIIFSQKSQVADQFELEMLGVESPSEIRFTTDASSPNAQSQIYSGSILINENTIVKAQIFREGFVPSKIQVESYLINATHDLPIVALWADPFELFDSNEGMYVFGPDFTSGFPYFGANFWKDLEIPMHFSLYQNDQLSHQQNLGAKIFGGWSRANAQRSFSLFARNKYGEGELAYPLFEDRTYGSFQSIVLRNSGNDWLITNLRDAFFTNLMEGSGLDLQAVRPVASYLNGRYWGLYNLREKISEHMLASKHNLKSEDINLLELNGTVIHGSNKSFFELREFVRANDLSIDANYSQVAEAIDIGNFIMHQLTQIYFDNTDWPGNNNKFWNSTESKWRWILFDVDFSFGIWDPNNVYNNTLAFALDADGPEWPNPSWGTLYLRKLLQNEKFKNKFVNQYADELNSRFLPLAIQQRMDWFAQKYGGEMQRHFEKWGGSMFEWSQNMDQMKLFAVNRPAAAKAHVLNTIGLPAMHRLTLGNTDTDKGSIRLNSLMIQMPEWSGDYFESVPIALTAEAFEGHKFLRWEGDVNSTDVSIAVNMMSDMRIIAVFSEISSSEIQAHQPMIFPNPTSGEVNIEYEGIKTLYDPLGQKISDFYSHSINLSRFPNGCYLVSTQKGVFKIIKH